MNIVNKESEIALIHTAASGDGDTFEALMRPYLQAIYRFLILCASGPEDAKDAPEETMHARPQVIIQSKTCLQKRPKGLIIYDLHNSALCKSICQYA